MQAVQFPQSAWLVLILLHEYKMFAIHVTDRPKDSVRLWKKNT